MANQLGTEVSPAQKRNFGQKVVHEIQTVSVLEKIIYCFVIFIPLAFVAEALALPPIYTFFISALAIVPLAKFLGEATEALASKVGDAIGGLLNASFGNAVELIISVVALSKGLTEVVKARLFE